MPRELTDSSREAYKKNIIRLNNGDPIKISKKGIPDYKFLKDTNAILEKIKHLKPNTQRSYLISIVSSIKDIKSLEPAHKIYHDLMMQFIKEVSNTNNKKSDTQEENWIPQEEVMRIYNELFDKVMPLLSLKKVNKNQWGEILPFVVLSLYVLQAPRRSKDYQQMKYLNTPKELGEDFKQFNYFDPKDGIFKFFVYKTAGTYNVQEIEVNPKLREILGKYMKLSPLKKDKNPLILVNYDGVPISPVNGITRILNKLFNRKISVSMLRSIYLTDKFSGATQEFMDTATAMGTSKNVIQDKYVKLGGKLEDVLSNNLSEDN